MAGPSPAGDRASSTARLTGFASQTARKQTNSTTAADRCWPPPHSYNVLAQSKDVALAGTAHNADTETSPSDGSEVRGRTGFARAGNNLSCSPFDNLPLSPLGSNFGLSVPALLRDEPDAARNREKVTFLSLPCKNNGRAPGGNAGGGLMSRLLKKGKKEVGLLARTRELYRV